jgi:hypothetical protein
VTSAEDEAGRGHQPPARAESPSSWCANDVSAGRSRPPGRSRQDQAQGRVRRPCRHQRSLQQPSWPDIINWQRRQGAPPIPRPPMPPPRARWDPPRCCRSPARTRGRCWQWPARCCWPGAVSYVGPVLSAASSAVRLESSSQTAALSLDDCHLQRSATSRPASRRMLLDVVGQGGFAFVRRTQGRRPTATRVDQRGCGRPTAPRASRSQPAMDGSELPNQSLKLREL